MNSPVAQGPATLLFTDLADSTALLHRVGDERGQCILRAHRQMLQDAVATHGGGAVKWLGDGLMTAFPSVADAVRCAIAMQQQTQRHAVGERLGLRIGLHVGEALPEEGDYVGIPVVMARRLCEKAAAGQILCSSVVVELLRGRHAFRFADIGALALKGFPDPVPAYEVTYEFDETANALGQTPFTGRRLELARLTHSFDEARAGRGGVVLLMGESGIGKTRTLEEFTERVRMQGALVLWGHCYEGEAGRPYGPFAEAIADYARTAAVETLSADLGSVAAPLGRLVPTLRARLPDLPEPVELEPYEERVRLIDAAAQFLLALAARVPTVLVLDDLHWADAGSVALLRHVARFGRRDRLLVLGAYRDVEIDRQHPLAEALGTLPRETRYEHVALTGLDRPTVQLLLDAIAEAAVEPALADTLARETSGNPFFIREVLLYLFEEGVIARDGMKWRAVLPAGTRIVPATVRQVIWRRLARLSAAASDLLRVASACTAGVPFEVVRRVAGLEEAAALNALDEALAAQLLASTADPDRFEFAHALVRHTLYEAQSPPRRIRLHRQIAEAMEAVYGARANAHAAEIAHQYHQSAGLPGAEHGMPYCLIAAERAERAAALEDVADVLGTALELLPEDDPRRESLLTRRGRALSLTKRADEAVAVATEAAELLAISNGRAAAADYLAEVASSIWIAGTATAAWEVARRGLAFTEDRRDWAWAVLRGHDLDRVDAEDPTHPGIVVDSPERRQVARFCPAFARNQGLARESAARFWLGHWGMFESRRAALDTAGRSAPLPKIFWAGEYRDALLLQEQRAEAGLQRGELAFAASNIAVCVRLRAALGDLAGAERDLVRFAELSRRAGKPPQVALAREGALFEVNYARGTGLELAASAVDATLAREHAATRHLRAMTLGIAAVLFSFAEREQDALQAVARAMPAVERAGGDVFTYTALICRCCQALWRLGRADFADMLERNLLAKTLAGDFREPGVDARLAMAQICSLTGRPAEAYEWFKRARDVLDEQGARPLRALVDLDEAWMEIRRGPHADRDRARALFDGATEQFQNLGMSGWIERANTLRTSSGIAPVAGPAAITRNEPIAPVTRHGRPATLRCEGDSWTITYAGVVARVKDLKGLHYLAHLLQSPGQEFHVLDLMVQGAGGTGSGRRNGSDKGTLPLLDAVAKAAYRRRLGDLRSELAEAERCNDRGHEERAREEIEALTQQLARAVGLGGRDRPVGSATERARSTVTQRLRAAVRRIAVQHAGLADHLAARVRTGTFCAYQPDSEHPVRWHVEPSEQVSGRT